MTNAGGYKFEQEVTRSARHFNMHVHKISTPRIGKSIYDIFCVYDSIPLGIECKAMRGPLSFSFDRVEPHQIDALNEIESCGGKGYIFINIRGRGPKLFAVRVKEFEKLKQDYASTRKSLPLAELLKLREVKRVKLGNSYYWDFRDLFV